MAPAIMQRSVRPIKGQPEETAAVVAEEAQGEEHHNMEDEVSNSHHNNGALLNSNGTTLLSNHPANPEVVPHGFVKWKHHGHPHQVHNRASPHRPIHSFTLLRLTYTTRHNNNNNRHHLPVTSRHPRPDG